MEHWCSIKFFKVSEQLKKETEDESFFLKNMKKNFFSLEIKASKKWYKEKSDELKSDFQRNISTGKAIFKA
jgi:hypothetical protein